LEEGGDDEDSKRKLRGRKKKDSAPDDDDPEAFVLPGESAFVHYYDAGSLYPSSGKNRSRGKSQ